MNSFRLSRRSFLGALAAGAASAAGARAKPLSDEEIFAQAEARIWKSRAGEVVLNLRDPAGVAFSPGQRVRIEQIRHKFLFGSNIFMLGKCRTAAENAGYADQFAGLFNYATLPFYWWMCEPQPGQPDYADTERVARWCEAHRVVMKGHPLAWNFVDPTWLPHDPEQAMRLQIERIGLCMQRFKNPITFWDVVNESTQFDRPETRQRAPILTAAIQRLGVSAYMCSAFRAACAANPRATRVINDYVVTEEYLGNVLARLVDEDAQPLYDVVGIQCHQHGGAWPPAKTWEICERFAILGKPLHFTETTILSGKLGFELKKKDPRVLWETTPEGEQRQAEEVARFYTILFSHPAVEAITWWDFSDQGAWQGAPAGLVRKDLTPKPAYQALKRLIKGAWWTTAKAAVDAQGQVRFQGFYGDYRVAAGEGLGYSADFTFDKTTRGPIDLHLL